MKKIVLYIKNEPGELSKVLSLFNDVTVNELNLSPTNTTEQELNILVDITDYDKINKRLIKNNLYVKH
jgi:acetolactate synthase small subunit